MKLWQIFGGAALSITLAGCASNHQAAPPVPPNSSANLTDSPAITGPNVSGQVNIAQRVALPADAVLTVTLSDASIADAPSRVIAQRVARTQGKQAPFSFILPYNPQDIKPDAHVILSAAISINGRITFITDNIKQVINGGQGTRADLQLVPVPSVPVPEANPLSIESTAAPVNNLTPN